MGMREWARKSSEGPVLYRRAWSETDNPLVAEARAQTLALQRLQTWLRLAYAILAMGALLGYWGLYEGHSTAVGVVGIVLGAVTLAFVMVLRRGIAHGRQNVNAMLDVLQAGTGGSDPGA